MNRKLVLALALTLLVGLLSVAFNVQRAKASGPVYIRADGSIEPLDAPISTIDYVTYTLTGNVTSDFDGIVVDKDSIVFAGAGYMIQGTGAFASKGIYLSGRSNVTVKNTTIRDFWYGICLDYTNKITLSGNNITGNSGVGVQLDYSSGNSVSGNNITNNWYGIYLGDSSNNSIVGNKITENNCDGIHLISSSNNTVSGNNVTANNNQYMYGIQIYYSSGNSVSGNNITNNWYGIYLGDSSNNSISGNNITNSQLGIYLGSSSNNVFYHNNFINNTRHVNIEYHANTWDDGYPSGGNYWSDYTGADEFSGSNQDQPGSDGIGDIPYVIDEDNRDHYPLFIAPKHELVISIIAPISLRFVSSSMLTAIVTNKGSSDEVSVELLLLINGTIANSTTISLLQAGNSYTLNYLWTPTVEGTCNVTAYAPPVLGEALTENNQQTILVNVSAPEIVASLIAPASLRVGTSSSLKAIVSNQGLSNETDIELWLLINGSIMNSKTISFLQAGDSYTLSYLWTPTVEGTYNVTAYARPVPGEASVENNQMTEFVTVTASAPPGVQVGVKAGDWIKVDYTITGAPSGTPLPQWLKVEFLSVEGINATVRVTMHMSDGTEQNATLPVDVVAGGQAFGLSGFVIPANLTVGDVVYMSGYGNITIAGETTGSYAGAGRTVVYASFSQYGTQLTYYWDKLTGVMVEASTISGGVTATGKATETSIWRAAPSGLPFEPIYLYILVALVIIIVAGATAFIIRRKKKPSEEVESPQI